LHLVRHRSSLKQRVHALLLTHGRPSPVSDLFGGRGRELLARLALPEPWQGTIEASLRLTDDLDREIGLDALRSVQSSVTRSPRRRRRRSRVSPLKGSRTP
jgi:hypothetical protein